MQRIVLKTLLMSALAVPAMAEPLPPPSRPAAPPPAVQQAPIRTASAERSNLGGGFIEFLFGGNGADYASRPRYPAEPDYYAVLEKAGPHRL